MMQSTERRKFNTKLLVGLFCSALEANKILAAEELLPWQFPGQVGFLPGENTSPPVLNSFNTPVHNYKFNKYRVYNSNVAKEIIESNSKDIVVLSGLDDWSSIVVPEGWEAKYSHTEFIPIISAEEGSFPDELDLLELTSILSENSRGYTLRLNGISEKYEPTTKYLKNILNVDINSPGGDVILADGYSDLSSELLSDLNSVGIGFRGANFEGKKLTKIKIRENIYTKGIPVNHVVFMKKELSADFFKDWNETLESAILIDKGFGFEEILKK